MVVYATTAIPRSQCESPWAASDSTFFCIEEIKDDIFLLEFYLLGGSVA